MQLSEEQNEFIEAVESDEHTRIALFGSAGTGKSFTTCRAVDALLNTDTYIILLTPSHTAKIVLLELLDVDVIQETSKGGDKNNTTLFKNNTQLSAMTIHAFLGMRPCRDRKVKNIFDDNFIVKPNLQLIQIKLLRTHPHVTIFVDEISMVGSNMLQELFDMLEVADINHKLIVIGDFQQIQPVNAISCKALVQHEFDKVIILTEIFRTSSSSITETANNLYKGILPKTDGDVTVCDGYVFEDHYQKTIIEHSDDSSVVYIAYRNKAVARSEKIAMKALGRDDVDDFKIGDVVRLHASVVANGEIFAFNGEQIDIQTIHDDDELDLPWIDYVIPIRQITVTKHNDTRDAYATIGIASLAELRDQGNFIPEMLEMVKSFCLEIDDALKSFKVVDLESLCSLVSPGAQSMLGDEPDNFDFNIASLVENYFLSESLKDAKWKTRAICWARGFFKLREQFLPISTAFALTAHKSQGGQMDYVFLDYADIYHCAKEREHKNLMYVGASRAIKKLYIKMHG